MKTYIKAIVIMLLASAMLVRLCAKSSPSKG